MFSEVDFYDGNFSNENFEVLCELCIIRVVVRCAHVMQRNVLLAILLMGEKS